MALKLTELIAWEQRNSG